MKIRFYLTLAALFVTFNCFANKDRIDSSAYIKKSVAQLQDSLTSVYKQLAEIKHSVEITQNDISSTNSSLSNIIASIGITLALAAIIIGLIAWFVNKKADKAAKTLEDIDLKATEVREILVQTEAIKIQVETLSEKMKNNLRDIYEDLQNQEVEILLDDLINKRTSFITVEHIFNSKLTLPKKFIPKFLEVIDLTASMYRQKTFLLLIKYWGVEIILEREDVVNLILKYDGQFTHYTHFMTFDDIKRLMDIIASKGVDNLKSYQMTFFEKFIISRTKQLDGDENPIYDYFIFKFSKEYYLKFNDAHIDVETLKQWIMELLNINSGKYKGLFNGAYLFTIDFYKYITDSKGVKKEPAPPIAWHLNNQITQLKREGIHFNPDAI